MLIAKQLCDALLLFSLNQKSQQRGTYMHSTGLVNFFIFYLFKLW